MTEVPDEFTRLYGNKAKFAYECLIAYCRRYLENDPAIFRLDNGIWGLPSPVVYAMNADNLIKLEPVQLEDSILPGLRVIPLRRAFEFYNEVRG